MCQVNMLQAKTELSKLINMLETGEEDQVIIARNGQPVAEIKLFQPPKNKFRVGMFADDEHLQKVASISDEQWAAMDKEIEDLFEESANKAF